MAETIPLGRWVERGADAVKCSCGGYAEQADTTPEEDTTYGCGRPGCCSRAFVCAICGNRMVARAHAPEME